MFCQDVKSLGYNLAETDFLGILPHIGVHSVEQKPLCNFWRFCFDLREVLYIVIQHFPFEGPVVSGQNVAAICEKGQMTAVGIRSFRKLVQVYFASFRAKFFLLAFCPLICSALQSSHILLSVGRRPGKSQYGFVFGPGIPPLAVPWIKTKYLSHFSHPPSERLFVHSNADVA